MVDFVKRMEMAVVNTFFQKRQEHRAIYKSGGPTRLDYILCRQYNLKQNRDCDQVVGESAARQYRMVVCMMNLVVRKMKKTKSEQRTKW